LIELNRNSLNIESNSKCTLSCPTCKRTDFKEKFGSKTPLPGGTITVNDVAKCIKYFDGSVDFCGQHSDPIFSPYLAEMLSFLKDNNRETKVTTAASHRSESWYINAFESNPDVKWTFGIDGPPNLSNIYRINQDGEHLFWMMLMAKSMKLKVIWKHIVFNYNENHIDYCKKLAKDHNIKIDIIIPSRSLPEELKPTKKEYQWETYKEVTGPKELKPRCINNKQQVCLSSGGSFTPCCWFDAEDKRSKDKVIDGFFNPELNINNNDNVKDIIEGDYWQNFLKSLIDDPDNAPECCNRHCKTTKPQSLKLNGDKDCSVRIVI